MKRKYSKAYVEITNICNKNCSFCPGTKRVPERMSLERFSHVCDSLVGLTDYIYLHVMGEPLTHPELCRFVQYASEKGFKCAVTTNGTLLSRVGDSLIESGVYKVNISVHSFEDGDGEEYTRYISSILDFADRSSQAGILTVLRLWNLGHDGGRNVDTLSLMREKFPDAWAEGARGARIRHKLHLEYGERFEWPDTDAPDYGECVFCYGLTDHFGILVDGRVIPCCLDREGEITLGNLFDTPIAEILCGERAEKIREGFKNKRASEELCRRCAYARRFKV